jgi:hypothetical protein
MIKKYTREEMLIRDQFAAVALSHWMVRFKELKEKDPTVSFTTGHRRSLARLSFYMADSMMEAREELVEIDLSSEL